MTKEFGKLSRQELKEIYAIYYQGQQEAADLNVLLKDASNEKIVGVLQNVFPWSYLYEMPFTHLLALFINCVTTKTQRKRIFRSKDPHAAFLKWAKSDSKPPRGFNKWTVEDGAIFLTIVKALQNNLQCLGIFGTYLNDLIAEARMGDDDALFDAILVDSCVLSSFTAGKRISLAALHNDLDFFHQLAKATTKTRSRRPAKKLDDLRFMVKVLDESIGLRNISRKKTFDLLVEDMELYPDTGKDTMKGFEKFFERVLKRQADMKT